MKGGGFLIIDFIDCVQKSPDLYFLHLKHVYGAIKKENNIK